MANKKQLRILKKEGVKVWNQWREEHLNETIDLSGANLIWADLGEANLSKTDLSRTDLLVANLSRANLSGAKLSGADLRKADLFGADLSGAILRKANLSKTNLHVANLLVADLRGANLSRADLRSANLLGAKLSGANLSEANLSRADLSEANLSEVDLSEADLSGADLSGADLDRANLNRANLNRANLNRANLNRANLSKTNLHHVNLGRANLSQATVTGVCFYNTARDDWMIDGIQCDYVFWDDKPHFSDAEEEEEKQWGVEHRTPKDRDFRPGEFEELYKHLPTFDYYFKHGFTALDAVVISRIVEAINEQHPEFELRLDSFHSRGQPHAKFTVLHKEYIEKALQQVTTVYETRIKVLEGQKDQLMKVIAMIGSGGITIGDIKGGVTITAGQDIIAGNKEQRSITAGRDYLEQVTGDITTGVSTQGTEAKDMSQLNTREELTAHYQLLSEKLAVLRKDYILETDTEVKFKLKKRIEEYEADLKEIERRLEELENKEDNTQKA